MIISVQMSVLRQIACLNMIQGNKGFDTKYGPGVHLNQNGFLNIEEKTPFKYQLSQHLITLSSIEGSDKPAQISRLARACAFQLKTQTIHVDDDSDQNLDL